MKGNFNHFKILIVDDEEEYREVFKEILDEKGYITKAASSGEEALNILKTHSFHLVLTDLIMKGIDGIELLEKIKEEYSETEVIIITGYGTVENAVAAMKKGAFTYFIKSHDLEELTIEIEKIRKIFYLENDNEIFKNQQKNSKYMLNTNNKKFIKIINMAEKAANSNVNILILGDSGVGKEVFAKYIHSCSERKDRHFLAVNCHAFSDNLLESELFGHEKGAFTGAIEQRKGRFEAAHGGTLFLDEIGDISLSTQVKLLRTIETKKVERIGSNKTMDVDFRLISATNKDIQKSISNGEFREDLFYRISTIIIEIPPLRDRKEDLPNLIEFFLEKSKLELKKQIHTIEKKVMERLLSYDYPGNVRELKNIIERLVVLSENGIIKDIDLSKYRVDSERDTKSREEKIDNNKEVEEIQRIRSLKDIRSEAEAKYIKKALEISGNNVTEAARKLSISRRQLFNKINEYKLR